MTSITNITTAEQLLAAGDNGRCELVRGELVMMSPAGARHGRIAMELARRLANHVADRRLGQVFAAETGFVLERNPDTVRAPDVSFVRNTRAHQVPDMGFFPGAPDLAVEVLSPDDTASDVLDKTQQWLNAGAAQVWIVNPKSRSITIYRSGGQMSVVREDQELDGGDLLPGFKLAVKSLFE